MHPASYSAAPRFYQSETTGHADGDTAFVQAKLDKPLSCPSCCSNHPSAAASVIRGRKEKKKAKAMGVLFCAMASGCAMLLSCFQRKRQSHVHHGKTRRRNLDILLDNNSFSQQAVTGALLGVGLLKTTVKDDFGRAATTKGYCLPKEMMNRC